MYATREEDVSPQWRYASEDVDLYSRNSAHGHQPKVLEITLTGCVGVFQGINARGDAHNNNNPIKYS